MILYMKNNLPLNLKDILEFFKNYEMSYILPRAGKHPEENEVSNHKFGENSLSSLFFDNALSILLMYIFTPFLAGLLIKLALKKYSDFINNHNKLKSFFAFADPYINYNMRFIFFQNSSQEISLFIALKLKYLSFSNGITVCNSLFCLFYLMANFYMIIWFIKVIKEIIADKYVPIPERYPSIFAGLNLENNYCFYFPIVRIWKKFLLSF